MPPNSASPTSAPQTALFGRTLIGRISQLCLLGALWSGSAFAQSAPSITQQPQSQSLLPRTNATFTVTATGQTPLRHQWSFNATNLTNSAHITVPTNATLLLSTISPPNPGRSPLVAPNS